VRCTFLDYLIKTLTFRATLLFMDHALLMSGAWQEKTIHDSEFSIAFATSGCITGYLKEGGDIAN